MKSLAMLCAAALLGGCAVALPGAVKLTDITLDALADNPLFQLATQDATDTLAWVKAHDPLQGPVALPPSLTPVEVTLASACPQAVLWAIPDLQTKVLALKQALGMLEQPPTAGVGLNPMLHLTILKYGVLPDLRGEIKQIRADIGLRMDALFTGCAHLFPAGLITR